MPVKTEKPDFIGVSKIVLRPKTKAEDFERVMKDEVFQILGADMTFRDGLRVGDNKLYGITGEGDSREYLWTTSYFRSQLVGLNAQAARSRFEGLCADAQKKIKKFGKLTPLGILSIAQGG
jgi:hypothetical protein